ncbi:hypothetical protein [Photobacterium sp. BZF1]|uniref:hypothetical protein n=1 Tax=Photobacterium sp. BZF1 TaxID=1904457 RepID=UPI001CA3FC70|nr:hypothetical protein [Photobacterium sp. BZF1]
MLTRASLSVGISAVLILSTPAIAKWENHADRYQDEYKNHLSATCPLAKDDMKHFVYFAGNRASLKDHPLLTSERFTGAQIMYPWALLEPEKGQYDFSAIEEDYQYLKAHGKKLFIQLQDATFSVEFRGIPAYLNSDEFDGGSVPRFYDNGKQDGWSAKRWNTKVQHRFALLIAELGKSYDGKIEGINLQETAAAADSETDPTFSESGYVAGIKANMRALSKSFTISSTMQYANFMPGEWLPWEDKGYLREVYAYGEQIGVGLGGPDLMMRRRGQLNHALAMMHENEYSVPLGIAIQDGNYIGETDNTTVVNERKNIVPALHSFAQNFLNVDYMFWVNQEPYFEQDVLPCFENQNR